MLRWERVAVCLVNIRKSWIEHLNFIVRKVSLLFMYKRRHSTCFAKYFMRPERIFRFHMTASKVITKHYTFMQGTRNEAEILIDLEVSCLETIHVFRKNQQCLFIDWPC